MIRRLVASLVIVCAFGSGAKAQVKLEYKVPEETTTRHKTEGKVSQVMSINGMDVETSVDRSSVTTIANGKRRSDGTLPINVTIDSIKIKMGLPGGVEVSLDSDDKDLKIDSPQFSFLADVFKALRGSGYTLVLDAKNKLKFVEGTEKNLAKAAELSKQAADALKEGFESERIKREYEQSVGNLPDGLVREGEPWERSETTQLGGGQSLTLKKRYEYKGTVKVGDKTLDKIAVKALDVVYKMDGNAESPVKVSKSDLKIESSEGEMLFDRDAGVLVEHGEKTRMKGNMTLVVTANGMELPAVLDLTLGNKTTIEKVAK